MRDKRVRNGTKTTTGAGGGYIGIFNPAHGRADTYGYVQEHVAIAEAAMGRPLPPGAEVHHVDGNRKNNRNDNLVVCPNHTYHMLIHQRQNAFDACGHADWRKCSYCKAHDDTSRMVKKIQEGKYVSWYHSACCNTYRKAKGLYGGTYLRELRARKNAARAAPA